MKLQHQPARVSNAFWGALFTLLLFFYSGFTLQAQPVTATNPDIHLDLHDYFITTSGCAAPNDVSASKVYTLNSDMLETSGGDKIFAVSYSLLDNAIKTCGPLPYPPYTCCFTQVAPDQDITGVHLEFTGATNFTMTDRDPLIFLGNGKPDVVIGDHPNGPDNYTVAMVYENSGTIELITLDATDVGTPSISVSAISSPVLLSTSGRPATSPHIDLFGDDINFTGSWHALTKFIAVWEEEAAGVHYIMAAIGDINNPSSFTLHQITPNGSGDPEGVSPDVAAMGMLAPCGGCDINTAFITYLDPTNSNSIMLSQIGLDAVDAITTNTATFITGTPVGIPRIESKALGDFKAGESTWTIAASFVHSMAGTYVFRITDQTTMYVWPLPWSTWQLSPVVTGVGEDMDPNNSGKIGETDFISGHYSSYTHNSLLTNGDFYATPIGMNTNPLAPPVTYEINSADLSQASAYTSPNDITMSVSTSSNTGDGLLSVWYDGFTGTQGLIHYKITNNTYNFRPTNINEVADNVSMKVHPNPVQDLLHIALNVNPQKNAMLSITDISGKTLKQLSVKDKESTIDMASLAPGMYMLKYTDANHNKTMRIVKE